MGIAIVGAPQNSNPANARPGAAYLFDAATGSQLLKLTPADGKPLDNFGQSVALGDGYALVGALTDEPGINSGSVYILDVKTGEQIGKLVAIDGDPSDIFGSDISFDRGTLLVGAPGDEPFGRNLVLPMSIASPARSLSLPRQCWRP